MLMPILEADFYVRNVIELKDEPLDSRVMSWINTAPVNDGGQWDMSVNLLGKYTSEKRTGYLLTTPPCREIRYGPKDRLPGVLLFVQLGKDVQPVDLETS